MTTTTRATKWDVTDELREHGTASMEQIFDDAEVWSPPETIEGDDAEIREQAENDNWPAQPDSAAFYGLAGEIISKIEPHTESDPVALLLQLLAGFGSVVGRGPYFEVEATRHPPRHFCVVVGPTSKARKGTSWNHVANQLRAVDQDWASERLISGLSSGEGLIWAVRDPIEKQEPVHEDGKKAGRITGYQPVITDAGVADKRLMVIEEEFASVLRNLGRDGNILSAVIRQAWDHGNLQTLTKNSPAVATGAHISIIGHITRDELLRYLNSTEKGNGFANRFLWVAVRRSKVLPEGGAIDSVDFAPLLLRLQKAVDHARTCGQLTFDGQAREGWHAVYPELSKGKPGLLGAVTGRAEAHVVRLALSFALLEQSAEIRMEHLLAALAVWEYCERSAAWIFGGAMGEPVADRIEQAALRAPEGITRTQIRDLLGRHQTAKRIEQALGQLMTAGKLRREQEDTGGRPAERFHAVRCDQSDQSAERA